MFNFKKKKYYIVMYNFNNGSGFLTMTTEYMDYLNRDRAIEIIKSDSIELEGNVVITNIIKLSKKEYDCWCGNKGES